MLVLLDTNVYLRVAKRIRPALGNRPAPGTQAETQWPGCRASTSLSVSIRLVRRANPGELHIAQHLLPIPAIGHQRPALGS